MKKIISLIALFLLLASQAYAFDDVLSDSEYYQPLQYLVAEGVVSSSNSEFRLDASLSRQELLKITTVGLGQTIPSVSVSPFSDITSDMWVFDMAAFAKANGIMGGYEDGTLQPFNQVTRAEAFKILLEAYYDDIPETTSSTTYSDVASTDWWAKYIAFVEDKQLLDLPTGSEFGVSDALPRKDAAMLLYNILIDISSTEGDVIEDVVDEVDFESAFDELDDLDTLFEDIEF